MLAPKALVLQDGARLRVDGAALVPGDIGWLLAGVEQLTPQRLEQMNHCARWLSFLILLASALLLAFGYLVGHREVCEMFMAAGGRGRRSDPQWPTCGMTFTLAIGMQAMTRRNAIVRRLPAREAIGSVSVICTEKTGR